ncbi:MAG: LacI family DNA-binding transcriptional regulator [Spirochaetaceae bacterium]
MRANLRRIAAIAGTSHTTVSRALNNSPRVAPETRDRILAIARELDYGIHAGARSLSTGLHQTVGVLYAYHRVRHIKSSYTFQLIQAIREELAQKGFDTLINGFAPRAPRDPRQTQGIGADDDEVTRLIRQRKVDGLLVIGYEIPDDVVRKITSVTDNCLLVNPAHDDWAEHVSTVRVDHRHGGALAADALLAAGCKRLSTMGEDDPQHHERLAGFRRRLARTRQAAYDSDSHFLVPDLSYENAYDTAIKNMDTLRGSDGVFAASDVCAAAVSNALQDAGRGVPEDIAVIGYDDVEWARFCRPSLTTIHQPVEEVAAVAATELVGRVVDASRERCRRVFLPRLVRRGSC